MGDGGQIMTIHTDRDEIQRKSRFYGPHQTLSVKLIV